MGKAFSLDYAQELLDEQKFQSKLLEVFFLANDEEIGDLTWKIAALPPEKRILLRQIIESLSKPDQ